MARKRINFALMGACYIFSANCFSASPAAWTEFRENVKTSCLKAIEGRLSDQHIVVDPYGSESYGIAIIQGKPVSGNKPVTYVCVFDKRSKQTEVSGELDALDKSCIQNRCPEPRKWRDGEDSPTCVNTPDGPVWKDAEGCFVGNPEYNARVKSFADAVFKRELTGTVGCLTYPYRGDRYDFGAHGEETDIMNKVHAGIDLRADGVAVSAITSGRVVERAYSPSEGRSTLIIETPDRKHRILYLHMKDITSKKDICQGDRVGTAGGIGTCPAREGGCPHLHLEVWPASSPRYMRKKAIWGCGDTKYPDEKIADWTVDPARFTAREVDRNPYVIDKSKTPRIINDNGTYCVVLSHQMEKALASFDPTFEILQQSDYPRAFVEECSPDQVCYPTPFSEHHTPFGVIGDFNGDDTTDAVLAGYTKRATHLIALLSTRDGFITVVEVARPGKLSWLRELRSKPVNKRPRYEGWGQGLAFVKKGAITSRYEEAPLVLKTDAFEVFYYEKGSEVFYYENGAFHRYRTSD